MSKRIMESTKSFFEQRLLVHSPDSMSFEEGSCAGGTILAYEGEADLVIYIHAENNPGSGTFAAAIGCFTNRPDNRLENGVYFVNFGDMEASDLTEFSYFQIFAHEFIHILGFSDYDYTYYMNEFANPVSGRQNPVTSKLAHSNSH